MTAGEEDYAETEFLYNQVEPVSMTIRRREPSDGPIRCAP
jgi:hypothetical protein